MQILHFQQPLLISSIVLKVVCKSKIAAGVELFLVDKICCDCDCSLEQVWWGNSMRGQKICFNSLMSENRFWLGFNAMSTVFQLYYGDSITYSCSLDSYQYYQYYLFWHWLSSRNAIPATLSAKEGSHYYH